MSAIGLRRLGFIVAAFVLQTALLRAALPGPNEARARPSLAGQLLVAAPWMGDPRFEHTVILAHQHCEERIDEANRESGRPTTWIASGSQ